MSFTRKCTKCQQQWGSEVDYCPEDGTPLGPPTLDRYELVRRVAQSRMSEVFEAKHVHTGKRVALKLLEGKVIGDEDVGQRLRREAQATSAIGDPNIVSITDFGTIEDGGMYMVMEWVEGSTLRAALDAAPIPPILALDIVGQVAQGLASAHLIGIIHRDIKPENIMVCPGPDNSMRVKILDFGVAKLTAPDQLRITTTGAIVGTPAYISPEQARGLPIDERADIYSLGCVLYELLTGTTVFAGGSPMEMLLMHANEEPELPSSRAPEREIPAALDEIVMRCIAKEKEERIPSMPALRDSLRNLEKGLLPALDAKELTAASTNMFESGDVVRLEKSAVAARAPSPPSPETSGPTSFPRDEEFVAPSPPQNHWKATAIIFGAIAMVATVTVLLLSQQNSTTQRAASPAMAAQVPAPAPAPVAVPEPDPAPAPAPAPAPVLQPDPDSKAADTKSLWQHVREHSSFTISLKATPRPLMPREPIELEFALSSFAGKLSWAITESRLRADVQFVHFVSHDTLGSLSGAVDDTGKFRVIFSVPRTGKYHLKLKFTDGSRVVGRTQMDICVGADPDAPDAESLCPKLNEYTGTHGAAR